VQSLRVLDDLAHLHALERDSVGIRLPLLNHLLRSAQKKPKLRPLRQILK
jgi:hypothetical protein